jgi:DNA repair protein RecO (recombination protein O)
MPEWSDTGIILSARAYGENKGVINLLTSERGRHAGLVHGFDSRTKKGIYEPGNTVAAEWRARLSEQLGSFQLELIKNPSAVFLDTPIRLAGLSSICAILDVGLPEREPVASVWESTIALIEIINLAEEEESWLGFYIRWEAELLRRLGFGLGLERCAVSGLADNLIYVSPKSGNAIHRDYAGGYEERMLRLPAFLRSDALGASDDGVDGMKISDNALEDGLQLTGHFLKRRLFELVNKDLPQPRLRLAHLVAKRYNNS